MRKILEALHRFDLRLFRRVAKTHLRFVDRAFLPLTRAANHSMIWMAIAAVLALIGRRSGRRAALRGMLSVGITSAIANGPIKLLTLRKRPSERVLHARRLRRMPGSTSFPSGHTASAFAFATGVALELPVVGPPLATLASAVGYSRVYTGVHYPGDVAAGALLGSAVAIGTQRIWPLAIDPADKLGELTRVEAQPSPQGEGLEIVINSAAGPALSSDPVDELKEELPSAELRVLDDPSDFDDALQAAAKRSFAVAVAGGDGSVNAAADLALQHSKPLLVIPAGTLNHMARDLGLEGVGEAIDAIQNGEAASIDVGKIDGQTFLNTASIGAYSDLVDEREKLESKIGKWPALVVALVKVLRRYEPMSIEIDGEAKDVWMVFIGNCRYHPFGFLPGWREKMDDGELDIRIVSASRPHARTRLLLSLITGRLARSKVYEEFATDRIEIRSLEGPLRLARDGETFDGGEKFTVEKNKAKLQVYVPSDRQDSRFK